MKKQKTEILVERHQLIVTIEKATDPVLVGQLLDQIVDRVSGPFREVITTTGIDEQVGSNITSVGRSIRSRNSEFHHHILSVLMQNLFKALTDHGFAPEMFV